MAHITITADSAHETGSTVYLAERVVPAHIDDEHSGQQLLERIGWAIVDADEAGRADLGR